MTIRLARVVGLFISAIGVVFLLDFLSVRVNPDVMVGNLGLLFILLGVLVIASDLFANRARLRGTSTLLAVAGWSLLSVGLLVGFAGFLLANQVMCSCPAYGPCACGVQLYNLMVSGGVVTAVAGVAITASSAILVRRQPLKAGASSISRKPRIGNRGIALVAMALTALVTFAAFSYYPGVYVTSVNEQTQFVHGMPAIANLQGSPPFMASSTPQPASGFQLPLGGSFVYTLHFSSVPSYPTYRIDRISAGDGFSVAEANASVPLTISPRNASVSITLTVRAPYYPYYGPLPILLTIENLAAP